MNILIISRKAMQPSNNGTGIPVIQLEIKGKKGRGADFFTRAQTLAVATSRKMRKGD